jgi:branched-chain amino acid transport system substrate-binding protein
VLGASRFLRTLSLAAAVTLLAAACGGGGGDGQGTDEPTGEPFKVGYLTDLSGVFKDLFGPTIEGFQLYIQALNDAGGIDGHPVEVVVRDDQATPDRAVSLAIDLATRAEVSAIFGLSGTPTHQPVYDEMEREEVPVVTGFSGIDSPLPPAQAFAYSAGLVAPIIGDAGGEFVEQVAPGEQLVCVTFETPGGIAGCEATEAYAQERGFSVGRVVFPVEATDYAPIAQDVLGESPSIVIGHFGSSQHARLIVALRQQGYEGPYIVTPWGTSEDSIIQAASSGGVGEGIFFYTRYVVVNEEVPGMVALRGAADQYGTNYPLQNTHVQGWVLAMIAHRALEACGFPCSPADFDEALQGLELDTEGLTGGPIAFSAEDHYGTSWWRLYELDLEGQRFDPAGDWVSRTSEPAA